MKIIEINEDLFNQSRDGVYFAHCISGDAGMGAGIAIDMRAEFGLIDLTIEASIEPFKVGSCVEYNGVLNLITKPNYWDKPTNSTMEDALTAMRYVVVRKEIEKIVMPRIGAGLDRLDWEATKNTIERLYKDIDIEFVVCYI